MNMLHIIPGAKVYINGSSNTIELTITKVGRKYATFDNSQYRYLLEYEAVEIIEGINKGSHTAAFESAAAAESFLEEKYLECWGEALLKGGLKLDKPKI